MSWTAAPALSKSEFWQEADSREKSQEKSTQEKPQEVESRDRPSGGSAIERLTQSNQ
jgi:hypothetical protein